MDKNTVLVDRCSAIHMVELEEGLHKMTALVLLLNTQNPYIRLSTRNLRILVEM